MSLNPRILAAALLVAVLALGAGFFLLGRGQGTSNAAVPVIKPLHPVKKHVAVAAKPAKKAVVTKTLAKPAKKVVAKPKTAVKHETPSVIDGMPAALALALRSHRIVVVSLYTPDSSVDQMATDEARHGAALAHAGFVAFNVADDKVVSPLASVLTGAPTAADRVLDGPAVLVFQRPSSLFVRFNGFADRDTVAQAAENAAALAR